MDKGSALVRLPYWDKLSESEKKYVSEHAVIRSYRKGEVVHGYGGACLGTALVLSGRMRAFILSEDGREITLFRPQEGESCVLSASCVIQRITFDTHMVAETDCELLVIGSAAFDKLVEENIYVKCFLYEVATERFSEVMWTMQQILFLKIDRRLAMFLSEECDRSGKSEVRMTHEQIAVQIGSAREVVARMLKRFELDELVKLGRGVVKIKDKERLKRI